LKNPGTISMLMASMPIYWQVLYLQYLFICY
jgi:ABC-type dipeptide/oligopeptide/nickel transport system permease component